MDITNLVPVILTIHVLIVLALIGVVLLQRSEGGALGMGGGGGGGFMSGRGAANMLTRSTSVLAALFFATSLGLAIIADQGESETEIIEDFTGAAPSTNTDGTIDTDELIRSIGGSLGTPAQDDAGDAAAPAPSTEPVIDDETPSQDAPADDTPPTASSDPAPSEPEQPND